MNLRADVFLVETEYGMVLLDGSRGEYLHVNRTGTTILRILLQGGTEATAAREVASAFDISEPAAERDVVRFCARLSEEGLIVE